jgi:hypothetical protein
MKRIPLSFKVHSEESVGSPPRFVSACQLHSLLEVNECCHAVVTLDISNK